MNIKFFLLTLVAGFSLTTLTAQEKDQHIVIRKKSDSKEKTTVVIDGDKVTINGKPIEEYKNEDIEVIRQRDKVVGLKGGTMAFSAPRIPRTAFAPEHRNLFDGDSAHTETRAFLGISTEKTEAGASIVSVTKESAAEKAGLQKGDVITKVGERKIIDGENLFEAIKKYKPEDKVNITYKRDGKENSVSVTLGKATHTIRYARTWKNHNFSFPELNFEKFGDSDFTFYRKPRLGIQIQDTENNSGVKVLDVDENTPAAQSGLKKDDVIVEANGTTVQSLEDIRTEMKDVKEGDILKLKYKRDNQTQTAEIKFPKRLKKATL